ncbi:hypothetical protein [Micromonospora sp. KC723]|uniref:hypothetical protein n=1 Tax=Micromonospora sp. KC723 TaxID=2530381 RepID=UPI001FB7C750|nr:hypothetical protein [Micromonospora sp. KC723]
MPERVRAREIDDDEGQRLLRIIRRGRGSVVTWRRAQMVLLSAQGMDPARIAEVTFTSPDRVRDVIQLPRRRVRRAVSQVRRWPPQERVGTWAAASNVETAYTPTNSSWLHRMEAQFTALRYLTLDGTDHASHQEQASMIRRYIIWRNRHADDRRLRAIVDKANVA